MRAQIRRFCALLPVTLLGALSAAHAADTDRVQAGPGEITQQTEQALLVAGDADSFAAAAEFSFPLTRGDSARRYALLTQAAKLAPDRADLVWLQISACVQLETCDPSPLAATLHRMDPDNGAAWAPLLDRAIRGGDLQAATHYMDEIGNSKRFDIYWTVVISHLTSAVAKTGTMPLLNAMTSVIGIEAGLAIPAYQSIVKPCNPPESERVDRHDVCRGIAASLRAGDTYITEMVGLAMESRLLPRGSAAYNEVIAARRVQKYRLLQQENLQFKIFGTESGVRNYLNLLRAHRSEQEVMLALIVSAGKSPEPPPGWKEPPSGG